VVAWIFLSVEQPALQRIAGKRWVGLSANTLSKPWPHASCVQPHLRPDKRKIDGSLSERRARKKMIALRHQCHPVPALVPDVHHQRSSRIAQTKLLARRAVLCPNAIRMVRNLTRRAQWF